MTRNNSLLYLSLGIILLFSGITHAVTTHFWEQKTSTDFAKGVTEHLAITSDGDVVLSPRLKTVSKELSELYIWALVADQNGNLYAGTGNGGKIFKITPDGRVSVFMDSPQVSILSLIFDKKGNLYAGTSPDGLIYKIEPNGNATTFYQTEQRYVWSLVTDNDGNVYAGTGTRGKIFRIQPDGTGEEWYDARETHIMTLLYRNQTLYAGGAGYGLIYKIDANKNVFVLYDAPEEEIHTLIMDTAGNLYAGSIPINFLDVPSVPVERRDPNTNGESSDSGTTGISSGFSLSSNQQSSVYRITPDGNVDRIWKCPEPLILSMLIDSQGNLLVGTGNNGALYQVKLNDHRNYIQLLNSSDSQLLAMAKSPRNETIYIATGNLGRLYKLSDTLAGEGILESDVYDTQFHSQWGVLSWESVTPEQTGIRFATRSGNTEIPDDTWSDWSPEFDKPSKITSPAARFIQWRATLTTQDSTISPDLYEVSLAFLPENMPPVISAISVYTAGENVGSADDNEGATSPDATNKKNGNTLDNGKSTVKWSCTDPNEDDLSYTLYFRGKGESNWKILAKDQTSTEYTWNTDTFPDGKYQIKVVATDSLDNPATLAHTTEFISRDFIIDNHPPVVSNLTATPDRGRTVRIEATATDSINRLEEAHYALDGGEWQLIFPTDHILDQQTEYFSFEFTGLAKGEHLIVLRVKDAAGNTGTQKTVFTVR
ncbi:MAG: hypothetical protein D6675_01315 [Gemmatimonadetes bacterium]|nr:MAG: hypothetical protein D6675_01315 [Gemmatimonadota bacterium]